MKKILLALTVMLGVVASLSAGELNLYEFEKWGNLQPPPAGWNLADNLFPEEWTTDSYPGEKGFLRKMTVPENEKRVGGACIFLSGRLISTEVMPGLLNQTLQISFWAKGKNGHVTARLREYTEPAAQVEAFLADVIVEATTDDWVKYASAVTMMPNWAPAFGRIELDADGVFIDNLTVALIEEKPAAAKAPEQVCAIPVASTPPLIDGKVSAGEWAAACGMKNAFMHIYTGLTVSRQTEYLVSSDGNKLFVLTRAACREDALKATTRTRDGNVWSDDSVEIYINPYYGQDSLPEVYQIIANSAGVVFDQKTTSGKPEVGWNCAGLEIKTGFQDGFWIIEMAIPLSEVGLAANRLFGLNLCRNLLSPTELTDITGGKYNDFKRMLACTIRSGAPGVQCGYLGNLKEGRLLLMAEISNTAATARTFEVTLDLAAEPKRTKVQKLVLGPTTSKTVTLDAANTPVSRAAISCTVTDEQKNTLFSETVNFMADVFAKAGSETHQGTADYRFEYYPLQQKVNLRLVDYQPDRAGQDFGRTDIFIYKDGRLTGQTSVAAPSFVEKLNTGNITFPFAPQEDGSYVVKAVLQDKQGGVLKTVSETVKKQDTPWLGNTLGLDRIVIPPFAPMTVKKNRVSCWGRQYHFNRAGLPEEIISQNENILAAPMRFVLETADGETVGTSAKGGSPEFKEKTQDRVAFAGKSAFPGMTVQLAGMMEYDGMVKYELLITPEPGLKVNRFSLEIPLKNLRYAEVNPGLSYTPTLRMQEVPLEGEYRDAKVPVWTPAYKYRAGPKPGETHRPQTLYLSREDGTIWSSRTVQIQDIYGNFIPHLWMGNERYGISWFADNDRGWVNDPDHASYEMLRKDGAVILKIHFISIPTVLAGPRKIVFGLLATPVRPRVRGANVALKIDTMGFANSFVKQWGGITYKDYWLAQRHNDARFRQNNASAFVYAAQQEIPQGDPVNHYMRSEWEMEPFGSYTGDMGSMVHKIFGPDPANYVSYLSCCQLSRNDYWAYCFNQALAQGAMDGVFYDNAQPIPCSNVQHAGCGYLREDGHLTAGFGLFEVREMMKRIAVLCYLHGRHAPFFEAHMSGSMCLPMFTFADLCLDGEWRYGLPEWGGIPDPLNYFPLPYFEVFGAAAWGVNQAWLPQQQDWDDAHLTRNLLAAIKLFDMWIYPASINVPLLNKFKAIEQRFGIDSPDCIFTGYWTEDGTAVNGLPTGTKASFYIRPGKGALVYVSNLTQEKIEMALALDFRKWALDGYAVRDAETSQGIVPVNSRISLTVEGHDLRVLQIEKEIK